MPRAVSATSRKWSPTSPARRFRRKAVEAAQAQAGNPAFGARPPAARRLCRPSPGNFIAVGLNYADHAAELGNPIPAEPILFNKAPSCVVGPNDDVVIPKESRSSIGKSNSASRSANAPLMFPRARCARPCGRLLPRQRRVGTRLSIEPRRQLDEGQKCRDKFGPLGPWLVTKDEIKDPQNLDMWLDGQWREPPARQYLAP